MDLLEIVHKCPFCGVFTGAFLQTHLKLSIQIMSQRVDVNPKCVAGYLPGWNVSHLALCLQFREKTFLRASAIMEKEDPFPIKIFVGHNSLELEDAVGRAKEIELNRAFSGLVTLLSVDEDSVLTAPGLGLPADFEERPFFVDEPPSFSIFDDPLEFGKSFEGHGGREFDFEFAEEAHCFVAEMSGIEPGFKNALRQSGFRRFKTVAYENVGSVGIMNVTRTLSCLEDLSRLSKRAENGIVAAAPFFCFVESYGRAFDVTSFRGNDRTIEVKRDSWKVFGSHSVFYEFCYDFADLFRGQVVRILEEPAQSRDGWQFLQADDSVDDGIAFIVRDITEPLPAENDMYQGNEAKRAEPVKGSSFDMREARSELLLHIDGLEDFIEKNHSGERSKPLFLEPDNGLTARLGFDILTFRFHWNLSLQCTTQYICGEIPSFYYTQYSIFIDFLNITLC